MTGEDVISQGELGAWIDEAAELDKAQEALRAKFQQILARIQAGATVQRGFYRVTERRIMGCSNGFAILDRTYEPLSQEEVVELGTRKAKRKGA